MSGRDADGPLGLGGWWWGVAATVLLLVGLVASVVAPGLRVSPGTSVPPEAAPAQSDEPARIPPPPGLDLPDVPPPPAVAPPAEARAADPTKVRAALRSTLSAPALGGSVAVAVRDLGQDRDLVSRGPASVTPASIMKLLTSAAVLSRWGGDHRFATTVVAAGPRRVVLVGGGDPFLARTPPTGETYPERADVATLAGLTARSLRAQGRTRVGVDYDASLFRGPALNPRWEPSYLPDNVVSPISALWVDEGREPGSFVRSDDPARDAAVEFARALRSRGITVRGVPRPQVAPQVARELARVEGAPLAQVVEQVLQVSDNEGAEVLARQAALAVGRPGSSRAGARTVVETLETLGVDASGDTVLDGSGLARGDRLSPETVLGVLGAMADPDHPELGPMLAGLPVAGFSGSLALRFDSGSRWGAGAVRAKTGTLAGVHGLAGVVTTRDGALLSFVAVADRARILRADEARTAIDRAAAALAGCRCAS